MFCSSTNHSDNKSAETGETWREMLAVFGHFMQDIYYWGNGVI